MFMVADTREEGCEFQETVTGFTRMVKGTLLQNQGK